MFRILAVDDDPVHLHVIRYALGGLPFATVVDVAASAEEARAKLERRPDVPPKYDLVVADDQMPGERGSVFLRELGRSAPRVGRVLFSESETAVESAVMTGAADAAVRKGDLGRFVQAVRHVAEACRPPV